MNGATVKIGGRTFEMYRCVRGNDALGWETDEMLAERIERCLEAPASGPFDTKLVPYEPRSGPIWRGKDWRFVDAFQAELQALCERFGVELVADFDEPCKPDYYLKRNSPNPHAEIVIADYVRDAIVYEVPDDRDPEGYSE